jgi:cytochrome P450
MPKRFMKGGSAAAMDNKGNDFQYLSFGAGRRICPGINFASSTIEVMLANLVYHFNWELRKEFAKKGIDTTESFGLTVHRTKKLLLVPIVPQD